MSKVSISRDARWSNYIKKRDGCCQNPFCRKAEDLEAHHIIAKGDSKYGRALRYHKKNGIALCRNCHRNIMHGFSGKAKSMRILIEKKLGLKSRKAELIAWAKEYIKASRGTIE
jgi:hypothetical protein